MAIFESRTLSWRGKDYSIPANKIFRAIAVVEEHVSRQQLIDAIIHENTPYTKIASAWAAALRYAGCASVTPDQTYEALSEKIESEGVLDQPLVKATLDLLGLMLLPKQMQAFREVLDRALVGEQVKGHSEEAAPEGKMKPAARGSQKRPTSSLSAAGESSRTNSGQ